MKRLIDKSKAENAKKEKQKLSQRSILSKMSFKLKFISSVNKKSSNLNQLLQRKETKRFATKRNSKMSSKRTHKSDSESELDLALKKEFHLNEQFHKIPDHQKKHMLEEIADGKMSRLTILHLKNLLS